MRAGQSEYDSTSNLEFESVDAQIEKTQRLARKMGWFFVIYSLIGLTTVGVAGYLVVQQTVAWRDALNGQEPNVQLLLSSPQSPLATVLLGAFMGLGLAAAGTVACLVILGRINWPALKVFGLLTGLPSLLSCAALVQAAVTQGTYMATILLPFAVAFSLVLVPMQLAMLSYCVLRLALRQLRSVEKPVDARDIPAAAADYFNSQETAALEAGLTPVGDSSYLPEWNKFRRYWMAPNGAYFSCATWAQTAAVNISGIEIYSATSDGHYFETASVTPHQSRPSGLPDDCVAHVESVPETPLKELIARHADRVGDWVCQRRCQPLEFTVDDASPLADYGVAALMREMRNDFLWLGNPYAGRPLPPLPGRPREFESAGAGR